MSRQFRIIGTSAYKLFFLLGDFKIKILIWKWNPYFFLSFVGILLLKWGGKLTIGAIKAFEKLKIVTVFKSGFVVNIHCP